MKQVILLSLMCLIPASLYAAAPTALIINETNCSCQDIMYTSCQLLPASKGVVIQAQDQNFQPYGPKIAVGGQGQAPLYNGDFITVEEVLTGGLASFEGASAGATYHAVMITFPNSDYGMLSIANHNPC